ncbi:AAA-like domain-containing protein [Methanoregula sp.]|uniref:AAA-like domain-containing protein n=1 Tax=Methanoregula sp. TaxID=2052170 RepID=UPI00356A431A
MGIIHSEVREQHLTHYPKEENLLKPFLDGFDITWGKKRKWGTSEYSVYFLKPANYIQEEYGFSREIMLVYSEYKNLEPRTIQAIEQFIKDMPAAGRVENLTYFLVSECDQTEKWVNDYLSGNPESRIIVPFYSNELQNAKGDAYFVRNILNNNLYGRDLFDYLLPLVTDNYFFGRKDIVASIYDGVNKNENKALFGLRKTGKTSILFKISRQISENNGGEVFFIDCQLPSVKLLRWYQLFEMICKKVEKRVNIKINGEFTEIQASETFLNYIEACGKCGRIILIFDEIENITPISDIPHWKKDFISFWQTFRAVQTQYRNVSVIIVGVNPYPCEVARIENAQNPLFGIVSYQYLKGLSLPDLKNMIYTLGKKMGLRFDDSAYEYIFEKYGGHPYLTRIACSCLNTTFMNLGEKKPIDINKEKIEKYDNLIDSTLFAYSGSVVSELKMFYKQEYDILELVASGQHKKFLDLAIPPEYLRHLREYGLLEYDKNKIPVISVPVVGRYIGLEYMQNEGRKTIYKIIEPNDRVLWLDNIKKSIINDFQSLERNARLKGLPSLFGPNSFPEADEFSQLFIVQDKSTFCTFMNTCHRCFVESIDKYGKSISKNNYFDDIQKSYPNLWKSLYRIKLYRHKCDHRELIDRYHRDFEMFIAIDLEGKRADEIPDVQFFMQQVVLDSLFLSIQIELNKVAS